MKLWKWIVKCPLLFLLLAGWIGLTIYTWSEGRMENVSDKNLIENPVFTALLEKELDLSGSMLDDLDEDSYDLGDLDLGDYDPEHYDPDDYNLDDIDIDDDIDNLNIDDVDSGLDDSDHTNAGADPESSGQNLGTETEDSQGKGEVSDEQQTGTKDGTGAGSGTNKDPTNPDDQKDDQKIKEEEIGITRFVKYKKTEVNSPYYVDPGEKALTTEYSYEKVGKEYFDDALFIGDSRTVGMQDYSGLTNATFLAKTGMNVYEVLEDKFTEPGSNKEVSVLQMLKNHKYGKIYFMVGINELGTGNTGTFQKAYARVLRKFRRLQPDAVIYIQGIIPVSKVKASGDAVFNNVNINDKNVAIAHLADGKNIFYLDVSGKLTDKKGYLKADYTSDEVHMYAQYYELWTNYLMKHAVVR